MRGGSGELSELFARLLTNADTGLTAFGDKARETVVLALAGDKDMVKTATARLESLLHRMEAVENFHESSLDCDATPTAWRSPGG
jgi:hypothetical protein